MKVSILIIKIFLFFFFSRKVMVQDQAARYPCATFRHKLVQVVAVAVAVEPAEQYKVHHIEVYIEVFPQAMLNPVDVLPLVVKLFVSPLQPTKKLIILHITLFNLSVIIFFY